MIELNQLYNCDCMDLMCKIAKSGVDLTLTDIPYNEVNRQDNGLRNLDKDIADVITFDLLEFLNEVYRITKNTIIIFCGQRQFSQIYNFFANKDGTVRQLIWNKTNPSPMNGEHIYLSGIENAVWFKKSGAVFNGYCKNTIFSYPSGQSKLHPTEKITVY